MFNGIVLGSVYALFGLGFNLVLGTLGVLNIAQGATFTWGALVGLYVSSSLHWPLVTALPAAMLASALASLLVAVIAVEPLRRKRASDMSQLIGTLGASIILVTMAQFASHAQILRYPYDVLPTHVWSVAGIRVTFAQLVILVVDCLAFAASYLFVERSSMGRALKTIAEGEHVAMLLGIPIRAIVRVAFFFSGALAGAAGVLIGILYSSVNFQMGDPYLLMGFVVIVLGGFGSMGGTVVASLLVGVLEAGTVIVGWGPYRDAILYAIMFGILLIHPNGMFGRARDVRP